MYFVFSNIIGKYEMSLFNCTNVIISVGVQPIVDPNGGISFQKMIAIALKCKRTI